MNKKSVTIGIPAYNEEQNIGNLLTSILSQKRGTFVLQSIIVDCSGSKDKTAQIVRNFKVKNPVIKLIDEGKRLGKAQKINKFYKKVNSDIFINIDADVILSSQYVLLKTVNAFSDKSIGLVSVKNEPIKPDNFISSITAAYDEFWSLVTRNINTGNNVHNHLGTFSAIKKDLYKKIQLGKNIVADDHYVFFKSLENGYKFKFVEKAIINYKVPNNLSDYLKQQSRWSYSKSDLKSDFGDWIDAYYFIPKKIKIKSLVISLIKKPVSMSLAIFLQMLVKLLKRKYQTENVSLWQGVASTKTINAVKI